MRSNETLFHIEGNAEHRQRHRYVRRNLLDKLGLDKQT